MGEPDRPALPRPARRHRARAARGAALADDWSYSYLYDCTDGKPSVPDGVRERLVGRHAGEWYVVGGKFAGSSGAAGDCCRMKFTLPGGGMNQFMMYNNDDAGATTYYFWNYTDNVEYRDEAGVWWNSGETASDGHVAYKNFWSSVWAVGAYGGHRYFGWYECGKEVATTVAGIPWVLADGRDLHSDDGFVAMIEAEMSRLGPRVGQLHDLPAARRLRLHVAPRRGRRGGSRLRPSPPPPPPPGAAPWFWVARAGALGLGGRVLSVGRLRADSFKDTENRGGG